MSSEGVLIRLLRYISAHGPVIERNDAARTLGLSESAITQAKGRLLARGCCRCVGHRSHVELTQYGWDVLAGLEPVPKWGSERSRSERPPSKQDTKPQASKGKAKRRRCLVCRKKFPSEGPGNQVCKDCKTSKSWQSGSYLDYPVRLRS